MNNCYPSLVNLFEDVLGWMPDAVDEDQLAVQARLQTASSYYTCYARIIPNKDLLLFTVRVPMVTPINRRQPVQELINRINWDLLLGCFEFHPQDGESRFRASVAYEDANPATFHHLAKPIMVTSIATTDTYFPAFREVIERGMSAERAYNNITHPQRKSASLQATASEEAAPGAAM